MNTWQRLYHSASLMWQVPLAVLSYLLNKVTKHGLMALLQVYWKQRRTSEGADWRPLCAATFARPLALPLSLTIAPRWNPHALIATCGPLLIREHLAFHLETVEKAAGSWSCVVYQFPNHRTLARIGALDGPFPAPWVSIPLEPGMYTVTMRYYDWRDEVVLPEIKVDGQTASRAQPVEPGINAFYQQLGRRENFFYLALNYYVYPMLRLRRLLPQVFVHREYLPVGDPGNLFYYGPLSKGQALSIVQTTAQLEHFACLYTFYDCASFPIHWYRIKKARHDVPPVEHNGFYLIRFLRTTQELLPEDQNVLAIYLRAP